MQVIRYKGENYSCCSPRIIEKGTRKYICDAWKERSGLIVRSKLILNALGQMLIRGGKW